MAAANLGKPQIINALTDKVAMELNEVFSGANLVALDLEGVDLGRTGQISIVQLSTPTSCCYLIDILNAKGRDDPLILWLRTLLEDASVTKIIHDCRMDSDALFHLFEIELVNVHDTSCFHHAISGIVNVNLNDTLRHNKLRPNVVRDGSVYRTNHAFWATRPLTSTMIEWASGDVQCTCIKVHLNVIQCKGGVMSIAAAVPQYPSFAVRVLLRTNGLRLLCNLRPVPTIIVTPILTRISISIVHR